MGNEIQNKVKKIVAYQTTDGCLHQTAKDAQRHEDLLAMGEWYGEHILRCPGHAGVVTFKELVAWLGVNAKDVRKLLRLL